MTEEDTIAFSGSLLCRPCSEGEHSICKGSDKAAKRFCACACQSEPPDGSVVEIFCGDESGSEIYRRDDNTPAPYPDFRWSTEDDLWYTWGGVLNQVNESDGDWLVIVHDS